MTSKAKQIDQNNSLRARLHVPSPTTWYFLLFFCLLALSILTILLSKGDYSIWASYFYLPKFGEEYVADSLMDFFNPINNAAMRGREGVYHSIYPPVTEIGFYVLSKFFPQSLLATGDAEALRASLPGLAIFSTLMVLILAGTCVLVILTVLSGRYSTWRRAALVAASCLLCEPFLYGVERGNTIVATPLLLLLFIRYYGEEERWKRCLSYLALIIAISLKLYPIVFLLLILKRNGLKEFLFVATATLCVLVLPFFFFKGVDSIKEFVYSLTHTTDSEVVASRGFGYRVNLTNTLGYLRAAVPEASFIPMQGGISDLLVQGALVLSCLLAFVPASDNWKTVSLLATVAALSPNLGSTYNICFLLVGIVCFLSGHPERSKLHYLYVTLFVLAIAPIPFSQYSMIPAIDIGFSRGYSATCFVNSIALLALWLTLCIDMALSFLQSWRKVSA